MSHFVRMPGTLWPMLRLATPVLLEHLLHVMVELVDLLLTCRYLQQTHYMAAMTAMVYTMFFVWNLFAFVSSGSTALVARFSGASDHTLANRAMNQSIGLGLILSLAIMAAGFLFGGTLLGALGMKGDAADAARLYLNVQLCVVPMIMVENVGVACLRAAGDTVSGLVVLGLVNLVNMGLSYALVVGLGPFPNWGYLGVAVGTAVGHLFGGLILLSLLAGGRAGFRLRLTEMWPQPKMVRRLLRIGVPGGIDATITVLCHLAYLSVINALGEIAAAAHGIGLQLEALSYMPGAAFQIATATMVGQYLGAKEPARAMRSALVACGAAVLLMGTVGLLFFPLGETIVQLFRSDASAEVGPLACRYLRIMGAVMVPMAMAMVFAGALRGSGDTRWPMVITIVGMIGVRVPLGCLLAFDTFTVPWTDVTLTGLGMGVTGAWCAAATDVMLRCVLMTTRFAGGKWRLQTV